MLYANLTVITEQNPIVDTQKKNRKASKPKRNKSKHTSKHEIKKSNHTTGLVTSPQRKRSCEEERSRRTYKLAINM